MLLDTIYAYYPALINKIYEGNLPNNVVDATVLVEDWFIFEDNVVEFDDEDVVSLLRINNTPAATPPIIIALTKLPNPHINHFGNLLFN